MVGIFNIINTSASRLQAAQQALDVIGQNIANVNTEGYSRQRVNLVTKQFTGVAQLTTGTESRSELNGVEVTNVERIKSAYVQAINDSAVAQQSALQAQVSPLATVEQLLNEPSTTGLQAGLDNFYKSWNDLANDPTSNSAGVSVINRGANVASQLNTLSKGVAATWTGQLTSLESAAAQANSAAQAVAGLNNQIAQGVATGQNVNPLLDQRDRMVSQLASLVGGVSRQSTDGMVSVTVGGVALVSGLQALTITVSGAHDITDAWTDPVQLNAGGVQLAPLSGSASGLLTSLQIDLPTVSDSLDSIAVSLRDAVNGFQAQGFTLTGDVGGDFFAGTGAGDLTAAISLPGDLAVSSIQGAADGSNAQKIGDLSILAIARDVVGGPGPSEQWQNLAYSVGAQVQNLNTAITSQTAVVAAAQSASDSESGVNLDEELTSMLMYQRSYQASSKVITAVDDMLQTLIGMVR
jgi:flagellar hook-associated protein 1